MNLRFLLFSIPILFVNFLCRAQVLPDSVFVGGQAMHVQGLAYDKEKNVMYFSFTSRFLKTDMNGKILASIDRIQGHLGAMTFNPADRKVYASLECKDDEIGRNISKALDINGVSEGGSVFYIAIIDVDKMTGIGMNPENDDVLKTVCIREACRDYAGSVNINGKEIKHIYGCSGIDGVTIAPKPGTDCDKPYLYIGYGIYGDTTRFDNDYQVLLRYDIAELTKKAKHVEFGSLHTSGPDKPLDKYFVYTGNSNYGVQNMAYSPEEDCIFLAVYKGKKKQMPNYDLFPVDLKAKAKKSVIQGVEYANKQKMLQLAQLGEKDPATKISGWRFKWGSTGLCYLGGGLWFISENSKNPDTKKYQCTARLYKRSNNSVKPFVPLH